MKKTISILGSTGSIGLNTFKNINKRKNNFQINLLSANKNLKLIYTKINIDNEIITCRISCQSKENSKILATLLLSS